MTTLAVIHMCGAAKSEANCCQDWTGTLAQQCSILALLNAFHLLYKKGNSVLERTFRSLQECCLRHMSNMQKLEGGGGGGVPGSSQMLAVLPVRLVVTLPGHWNLPHLSEVAHRPAVCAEGHSKFCREILHEPAGGILLHDRKEFCHFAMIVDCAVRFFWLQLR